MAIEYKDYQRKKFADHLSNLGPEGDAKAISAVLIPFIIKNGEPHIILTKRSQNISLAGWNVFPGGRVDKPDDKNYADTALREANEEIGLKQEDVKELGILGRYMTKDDVLITAIQGFIENPNILDELVPDPNEVEKIHLVALSQIFDAVKSHNLDEQKKGDVFRKVNRQEILHYVFSVKDALDPSETVEIYGTTSAMLVDMVDRYETIDKLASFLKDTEAKRATDQGAWLDRIKKEGASGTLIIPSIS